MKRYFKMLCLMLCMLMMTGVLSLQSAAADMAVAEDMTAFDKLEAFGVLEANDNLKYEDEISRGTFLRYAARLLGSFPTVTAENPYADITVEDDCYDEVLLFFGLGYINGEQGSLFRPNDAITTGEAAKILLGILGYGEAAAQRLSFPSGYITVAQRLGLFEDIETAGTFNAQTLAVLMLNTLEAPLLELETLTTAANGYGIRYTDDRDETLLSQRFSIYQTEGLLDSNAYSSVYGASTVPNGCVSIGGVAYEADKYTAAILLGYYVEGYYKKTAQEPYKLIYLQAEESRNTVLEARGKDIDADSITESGFSLYDEANGKTQKVKTERALVMLYNGVQADYDKSFLTKDDAFITLIDNDNDGRVEIVSVMEYRSIVVSSVSRDGVVTDKLDGLGIALDETDKSYDLFINDENGSADLSAIAVGDVLSYAASSGAKPAVKFVYISHNSISGTVTAKDDDGLQIDGRFYECEKDCLTDTAVGHNGSFLIDYFGRIVSKTIERDVVFGYLNQLAKESFAVRAKIFTENGRWVELKFKETFRFNDSKTKAEDFYKTYGSSTSLYRQLVTYTVNDDAEIISLNFAAAATPWTDENRSMIDNAVFRLSVHEDKAQYRAGMTSLGNTILLSSQTKLFMVPQQNENAVGDEDEFYITTRDSLVADREYQNIYAYNADAMQQAEVCVLIGNAMAVNSTSKLLLVESVATGVKEDGSETYVIYGMYMGADMSIQTKDKSVLDKIGGLSGGDVIQIVYDNDGYVVTLSVLYSNKNGSEQQFLSGSLYALSTVCVGRVKRYDASLNRIAVDYKDGIGIFKTDSLTNVYLYHTKSGKTERITAADIQADDYVVGLVRYFSCEQMIVIRS